MKLIPSNSERAMKDETKGLSSDPTNNLARVTPLKGLTILGLGLAGAIAIGGELTLAQTDLTRTNSGETSHPEPSQRLADLPRVHTTTAGFLTPLAQLSPATDATEPTTAESETAELETDELEVDTPTFDLEEITVEGFNVTGGRRQQETFRTPNTITVITREVLEQQQTRAQTLEDILRFVPGFQFDKRGGFFTAEPQLRGGQGGSGSGQSGVLILVDGIRRNNNNGTVNVLSDYPLNQIERVEVLRGAASSLYGTDAVDGVINIITRQPDTEQLSGEVTAFTGGIDTGANLTVSGGWSGDDPASFRRSRYLFQYGTRDARDFQDGAGDRSRNRLEEQSFSLKFTHDFDLNQALSLEYLGVRNRIENPLAGALPVQEDEDGNLIMGPPRFIPIDITFPQRDTDQVVLSYRHLDVLNSELEAQVYYTNFERNFTNTFGLNAEIAQADLESVGAKIQLNSQLSPTWQLTWGLDAYHDSYRNQDNAPDPEALRAELSNPQLLALAPSLANFDDNTVRRPNGEQRSLALFAQNDWDFTPNFRLSAGLRLDVYRQRAFAARIFENCTSPEPNAAAPFSGADCGSFVNGQFVPNFTPGVDGPAVVDFAGQERQDTQLVPNVGFSWAVSPEFVVYGTYSQGIQQPSFFDLYGGPQSFGVTQGNPDLTTQTSQSLDLGIRYQSPRVAASLVYFRQNYRNRFINVGAVRFGSNQIRFVENLASSQVEGLEAELSWQMAPALTFFGTYTLTEGRSRSDLPTGNLQVGDRLPNIVPWQMVLGLLFEDPDSSAFARLQARIVPDLSGVTSATDPRSTRGFTTVDLDFGVPLHDNLVLSLGVQNLFNTLYREPFSSINSPGTVINASLSQRF